MSHLRRMGIALGSLVAAWLVIWLIGGQTLGMIGGVMVIVLGALIYRDIIRRDRPRSP
jgi:hypothetical protein